MAHPYANDYVDGRICHANRRLSDLTGFNVLDALRIIGLGVWVH